VQWVEVSISIERNGVEGWDMRSVILHALDA
jgi:hypothetical protein